MKIILPENNTPSLLNEVQTIQDELQEIKKQNYIRLVTEGVDDPGILKCVFMAGGPGSGKSYTAKELFGVGKDLLQTFSAGGLKIVNSDTAFERGLKQHGIDSRELANIEKDDPELWDKIQKGDSSIRGRAKELTKKQQKFYEEGRLGMIIDGTGRRFSKIQKQKDRAEKLGYDCFMIFVNTSLEVAMERNQNRDRVLADEIVQSVWKSVQENMGKFQSLFSSRNFVIVDNTVYGPIPKEIQKAVNEFERRPLQNPIGKKWVQNARALKKANMIR